MHGDGRNDNGNISTQAAHAAGMPTPPGVPLGMPALHVRVHVGANVGMPVGMPAWHAHGRARTCRVALPRGKKRDRASLNPHPH